ncbi:hypothetical protein T492DRAFT_906185 [Pavlovales sp. CCMP2436]|nr:hypothetical protein T492DRAFT_906185 [Pavlovales sp. CCMP2436]
MRVSATSLPATRARVACTWAKRGVARSRARGRARSAAARSSAVTSRAAGVRGPGIGAALGALAHARFASARAAAGGAAHRFRSGPPPPPMEVGGLLRGSHDAIVLLTLSPGGEAGYKGKYASTPYSPTVPPTPVPALALHLPLPSYIHPKFALPPHCSRSRDTNGWPPNAKAMRAVYESSVRCYAWLHSYKLVIERNDQRARHRFVGGGELHGAARLKKSVCVNIYKNVWPRKGLPVSQWCSNNTLLA